MTVAERMAVAPAPCAMRPATVSVVVPCFNAGPFLDECVGSVLGQGVPDTEIIVVDDGSTEPGTGEVLARLPRQYRGVTVVRTENQGPGPARNVGLARATGRYVLLLDADDLLGRGYLPATIAALEARPDRGVAYTDVEVFGLRREVWPTGPLFGQAELYLDNWLPPALLARRAALERAGGFDPAMPPYGEDWDFCLRLHEAGVRFEKVAGVRTCYRIRSNSLIRILWRRPLMINRLVLNHKAAYGRLFGWPIGRREEERVLRLLRLAGERPGDERAVAALRRTRVCRQFEAWNLAYRLARRLTRAVGGRMPKDAGR
jgi:glycosyltransferase involved in cell wall biosynthesis